MASFAVMVVRVWDSYVTNSILTGWLLSTVNTYNSSLICAWIIFLCDLVYIMDALARTSKNSQHSSSWASLLLSGQSGTILANFITVVKFVTFIPYHVLVILELDIYGVYLLVCSLRVIRLLQSGRLYVHVTWTLTSLAKNGGLLAQSVTWSRPSRKPGNKIRKAKRVDHMKKIVESSPFMNHMHSLLAKDIDTRLGVR